MSPQRRYLAFAGVATMLPLFIPFEAMVNQTIASDSGCVVMILMPGCMPIVSSTKFTPSLLPAHQD